MSNCSEKIPLYLRYLPYNSFVSLSYPQIQRLGATTRSNVWLGCPRSDESDGNKVLLKYIEADPVSIYPIKCRLVHQIMHRLSPLCAYSLLEGSALALLTRYFLPCSPFLQTQRIKIMREVTVNLMYCL